MADTTKQEITGPGQDRTTAILQARPHVPAKWRMAPGSLGEAMEMAQLIAGSELCPKAYRGKPADCIVAYEYGAALGLSWLQSLRNVACINGIPSIYGDAVPAIIYASGECEWFHEYSEGEPGTDSYTAICIMKRRGMPDEVRRTFSVADAKTAKLWGKRGREGQDTPWITSPHRMLQMRARGFGARDAFADKLAGLILAEEAMDYPTVEAEVIHSETVEESPAVVAFRQLPEGIQESIEKAFEVMNFSAGQRLTKLNEYFGGDDEKSIEDRAVALLDWLKDEYAKRKTGQPRKRGRPPRSKESAPVTEKPDEPAAKPAVPPAATAVADPPLAKPLAKTVALPEPSEVLF